MKRSLFLLPALMLVAGCTQSYSANLAGGVDPVAADFDTAAAPKSKMMAGSAGRARGFNLRRQADAVRTNLKVADNESTNFKAPAGRKMTYSTRLVINVPDTVKGVKAASSIAEKYSGYTEFSDNSTANVKVPVEKAQVALKDFENIGTVTSKTITANDVTEHYSDTKVRLDNLRKLQTRMSELLSRANRVEDILRIERELARVTTDLERHQARMNVLEKQIAMVDFHINFNAIVSPVQISRNIIPVAWVRNLGVGIRYEEFKATADTDDTPLEFALPSGFAITEGTDEIFKAANSDNVVLKLECFDNLPGADLNYYKNLIARQLKYASYSNIEFTEDTAADGVKYLNVTAAYAKDSLSVMVAIYQEGWICKEDKVSVLEIHGPAEAMKKIDFNKIFKSFKY